MTLIQLDVFETFSFKPIRQLRRAGSRFKRIERWRPLIFKIVCVRSSIEFQFQGVCQPVSLCKTVNRFIINDGRHKVTTTMLERQSTRELLYVVLRLDTRTGLACTDRTHPRSIFFDKKPSEVALYDYPTYINPHCALMARCLRVD